MLAYVLTSAAATKLESRRTPVWPRGWARAGLSGMVWTLPNKCALMMDTQIKGKSASTHTPAQAAAAAVPVPPLPLLPSPSLPGS
eukprot:363760-Chlamydomonas_euryale.AAC.11